MTKKKKKEIKLNQNLSSISASNVLQVDPSSLLAKSDKTVFTGSEVLLIPENKYAFDPSIQLGSLVTAKLPMTAPMTALGLNDGFIKSPYGEQAVGVYNPTIADFLDLETKKELSEKEIEDIKNLLSEKRKLSKDEKNPITVEEVAEEVMRKFKAQEADEKTKKESAVKSGMKIIKEKIKNGGYEKWICPKCGATIEKLDNIKIINKYLKEFKKGKLKECPSSGFGKNHLNWFEVREDGMVWSIKTVYESEFRKQK